MFTIIYGFEGQTLIHFILYASLVTGVMFLLYVENKI